MGKFWVEQGCADLWPRLLPRLVATVFAVLLVLSPQPLRAEEPQALVQIIDPFLELHTGPGRGYPVFYVAERGEWVDVLLSKTTWYKVRLKTGEQGWVPRKQLVLTLNIRQQAVVLDDADFAEFQARHWEFGISHGDLDGAAVISAYGGWHFTENLTAELTVAQALGNFSEIDTGSLSLTNEPFPRWRVSPFFGIGTGTILTKPRATLVKPVDRQDDMVFVTVGFKAYLTRRFMLRLDYRNMVILTSRNQNEEVEEWKLGFSIFF